MDVYEMSFQINTLISLSGVQVIWYHRAHSESVGNYSYAEADASRPGQCCSIT